MDISDKISVPKSTLGDWQRRYAEEIQLARAGKWEYVEDGIGYGCEADLIRLVQRLRLCEAELSRRSLARMSNSEIIRLTFATRREYFKRRDPLLKPLERPRPTPNLTPNPNRNLNLNGHSKPEKTGRKPEINSNPRNGSHLPPHKNPDNSPPVTPEVMRGHFSSQPSDNPSRFSADAVHDSLPGCGREGAPSPSDSRPPSPSPRAQDAVHDSEPPPNENHRLQTHRHSPTSRPGRTKGYNRYKHNFVL